MGFKHVEISHRNQIFDFSKENRRWNNSRPSSWEQSLLTALPVALLPYSLDMQHSAV
jgi:hypothetical protein